VPSAWSIEKEDHLPSRRSGGAELSALDVRALFQMYQLTGPRFRVRLNGSGSVFGAGVDDRTVGIEGRKDYLIALHFVEGWQGFETRHRQGEAG
jgi:hypothetical protein